MHKNKGEMEGKGRGKGKKGTAGHMAVRRHRSGQSPSDSRLEQNDCFCCGDDERLVLKIGFIYGLVPCIGKRRHFPRIM